MSSHQKSMQDLIQRRRAELEAVCTSIAEIDVELAAIANRIISEENQFTETKRRRADLERVRRAIDLFIQGIICGERR